MTTPTNGPTSLDAAQNLSVTLAQNANDAMVPTLSSLDQLLKQRADRLMAAADRLTATLGAGHPRVIALTQAATSIGSFQHTLHVEAARAARYPTVEPNEWMVYGRVLDPQGAAVPGLRVRVYDRDRKYDDLLGDTTTDEFGDFAVKYHERDFAEVGEANPDLYVMVSDSAGTLLFSSKDKILYEAGRVEYFEIVLDIPQQPANPTPPRKPKSKPAGVKRSPKPTAARRTSKPKGSGGTAP